MYACSCLDAAVLLRGSLQSASTPSEHGGQLTQMFSGALQAYSAPILPPGHRFPMVSAPAALAFTSVSLMK